jgi:hypothetical protein
VDGAAPPPEGLTNPVDDSGPLPPLPDQLRARACPAGLPHTGDHPERDHGHTDCWLLHRAADRIEELEAAISAHRGANDSNCADPSCELGCGHDLRLYAVLDADRDTRSITMNDAPMPEQLAGMLRHLGISPEDMPPATLDAHLAVTDLLLYGETFAIEEADGTRRHVPRGDVRWDASADYAVPAQTRGDSTTDSTEPRGT